MVQTYVIIGKLVKQGNSLHIRIPSYVIKAENLKQGHDVCITLDPNKRFEDTEQNVASWIRICRKIKQLDKFDTNKLKQILAVHYRVLNNTRHRPASVKEKFLQKMKKEYGEEAYADFREWAKLVTKYAYITEKDGTQIVKPDYYL